MQTIMRVRELLDEAKAELTRYDSLRANTISIIESYEQRLKLLGSDAQALTLPGVEEQMQPKKPPAENASNRELFEDILKEADQPISARTVAKFAQARGWSSQSNQPIRVVDSTLRKMVSQGQLEMPAAGKFAVKRNETQAAT